jgi:hypothetical protein
VRPPRLADEASIPKPSRSLWMGSSTPPSRIAASSAGRKSYSAIQICNDMKRLCCLSCTRDCRIQSRILASTVCLSTPAEIDYELSLNKEVVLFLSAQWNSRDNIVAILTKIRSDGPSAAKEMIITVTPFIVLLLSHMEMMFLLRPPFVCLPSSKPYPLCLI